MFRQMTRADLPKKRTSAQSLHKPAFLNGKRVYVSDINFADDDLCYLEGAKGIPTKISDLGIKALNPGEKRIPAKSSTFKLGDKVFCNQRPDWGALKITKIHYKTVYRVTAAEGNAKFPHGHYWLDERDLSLKI